MVAIGLADVRSIQVKAATKYLSGVGRLEQREELTTAQPCGAQEPADDLDGHLVVARDHQGAVVPRLLIDAVATLLALVRPAVSDEGAFKVAPRERC